jgi:hypothetical protein
VGVKDEQVGFRTPVAPSKYCTGVLTEQHGDGAVCGVFAASSKAKQSSALSLSALRETAMRIMVDPG